MSTTPLHELKAELNHQHRQITAMMQAVRTSGGPLRVEAFEQFRAFLAAHEAAEQTCMHGVARAESSQDLTVVSDRVAEEVDAADALAHLESLDLESPEFSDGFASLSEAIRAHAEAEEYRELPAYHGVVSDEEVRVMVDRMRRVPHLAEDSDGSLTFAQNLDRARHELG
ncbi:hemerythrin domain-containing protein [Luteipulveratus halotolerans]|uniref:hemerythrin domain-containing protein n=1 Tax=Luteipulveratus halotolerans TaxID=1631356 RepID=UPI00068069CB|nr:hemerythrin domain-containing protein [Luteipulveratus halotolerans]